MAFSQAQIEQARGQNRVWRRKLGKDWPSQAMLDKAWLEPNIDSDEFIRAVADYQSDQGLMVDGVIGPKTAAKLRGADASAQAPSNILTLGGAGVPVDGLKVVSYASPGGLEFDVTHRGAWKREETLDKFCIHAKGAEGSAAMTWSFLRAKGLGIQFSIERDGTVYQYCDPAFVATAHAGHINDTSCGVEMTNAVFPVSPNPHSRPLLTELYVGRRPDDTSYNKETTRKVLGMLAPQLDALVLLAGAVCGFLRIPRVIPARQGRVWSGLLPELKPRVGDWKRTGGRLLPYQGVMGHYHVTNSHVDPTGDCFSALLDAGFTKCEV